MSDNPKKVQSQVIEKLSFTLTAVVVVNQTTQYGSVNCNNVANVDDCKSLICCNSHIFGENFSLELLLYCIVSYHTVSHICKTRSLFLASMHDT